MPATRSRTDLLTLKKTRSSMANKSIGWIPYSLGARKTNPSDKDSEKKIFAFVQERETIGLELLAGHIKEHGSSFSKGTIFGVLTDMVECMQELLISGYGVKLDGLGKIYNTLSSEGADSTEEFNTGSIRVNTRFLSDESFNSLINSQCEFRYVTSREAQAEAKKKEKAELDEELGAAPDDGGPDTGGDVTE